LYRYSEEDDGEEVPAGIPDFWLLALKNHEMIEEQITERDEPALKHLIDVTSSPLEGEQKGFTLDFHFEQPNPFFSNAVITKTYNMVGPGCTAVLESS
jgi:nucleosome assembly protein 1-like 1